jgi:hypothetical protein
LSDFQIYNLWCIHVNMCVYIYFQAWLFLVCVVFPCTWNTRSSLFSIFVENQLAFVENKFFINVKLYFKLVFLATLVYVSILW